MKVYLRQQKSPAPAQASEDWPVWTLVAALFAAESDRGIGDTLNRELGGVKSERFKRWHETTFGLWATPCGCGKLRRWNTEFPYPRETQLSQSVSNPL